MVQIGRMNIENADMGRKWEAIREIQRRVPEKRENVYITTAIDLEYDDVVHLSTESNRILGRRLANLALSHVGGFPGYGKQIEVESMELVRDAETKSHCLKINYSGVSGALKAAGNPGTFQLRFGDESRLFDVVSRVSLDPAFPHSVFLHLSRIPEAPPQFYCGPGIHPTMNITDSLDMPLPAFGPLRIDFELLEKQGLVFQ